jgi:GNAT superfamily N-acetyltransferase
MKKPALVVIRRARPADLQALSRLGAGLARAHHRWDPKRFFTVPRMDEGYAWWLGRELKNRKAVVLAAELSGRIVGYAYGRIEPRDWNALRDECGVGIDLVVAPNARGRGIGRLIGNALLEALGDKGAPRVILQAAAKNKKAQTFFRAMGFRPTVVEMARELGPKSERRDRRAATQAVQSLKSHAA